MRVLFFFAFLCISFFVNGQQSYYSDVNLNLTGIALKSALATKITNTHTKTLSYDGAKLALMEVDLDPNDGTNTNVLLLYGFSSSICPTSTSDDNDHRRRNKDSFGGGSSCEWNREHTYPKSLGTPNLEESGPGADAHHLRACDVQRNSTRSSDKFVSGSGNSRSISSGWYPGDEWKGDVARMMMYMYLRYNSRCLPKNVGVGNSVSVDTDMIDLFLTWNAEDPVSQYEINRNNYLGNSSNTYGQGNRNPFIDNPYLATRIWGGPAAQDLWGIYLSDVENLLASLKIYPNPASEFIFINTAEYEIETYTITNLLGQDVQKGSINDNRIHVETLTEGVYFITIYNKYAHKTEKIIIN